MTQIIPTILTLAMAFVRSKYIPKKDPKTGKKKQYGPYYVVVESYKGADGKPKQRQIKYLGSQKKAEAYLSEHPEIEIDQRTRKTLEGDKAPEKIKAVKDAPIMPKTKPGPGKDPYEGLVEDEIWWTLPYEDDKRALEMYEVPDISDLEDSYETWRQAKEALEGAVGPIQNTHFKIKKNADGTYSIVPKGEWKNGIGPDNRPYKFNPYGGWPHFYTGPYYADSDKEYYLLWDWGNNGDIKVNSMDYPHSVEWRQERHKETIEAGEKSNLIKADKFLMGPDKRSPDEMRDQYVKINTEKFMENINHDNFTEKELELSQAIQKVGLRRVALSNAQKEYMKKHGLEEIVPKPGEYNPVDSHKRSTMEH